MPGKHCFQHAGILFSRTIQKPQRIDNSGIQYSGTNYAGIIFTATGRLAESIDDDIPNTSVLAAHHLLVKEFYSYLNLAKLTTPSPGSCSHCTVLCIQHIYFTCG
jgi:hypothetical protein